MAGVCSESDVDFSNPCTIVTQNDCEILFYVVRVRLLISMTTCVWCCDDDIPTGTVCAPVS